MKAFLVLCFAFLGLKSFAQTDTLTPPFKRYPVLPPLQLILADSTTKYTKDDLPKNKQVLVVLFSPDCEHCQHEAEMLAANSNALDKVHIVMVTTYPIYRMTAFADAYGLSNKKNVVFAKDPHYFLIPFYDVRTFPFMALYNRKGNLIQTMQGTTTVEKLLDAFNGQ